MFIEFAESSLLWDWYHSPFGLIAFWGSLIVALLVTGSRGRTSTGSIVNALVLGSVVATLPLGLSQMGIGFDIVDERLVTQLSIAGFAASLISGIPYLMRIFLGPVQPTVEGRRPDLPGDESQTYMPNERRDVTPGDRPSGNSPDPTAGAGPEHRERPLWELEVLTGSTAGTRFQVTKADLTVGRSPDNDVVIDDPTVSRLHARISPQGDSLYVEDLGSKAGSILNGEGVDIASVSPGSEIIFGKTVIRINRKGEGTKQATQVGRIVPAVPRKNTAVVAKQEMPAQMLICPASGLPCTTCGGEASCMGFIRDARNSPPSVGNDHDRNFVAEETSIGNSEKMSGIWVNVTGDTGRGRGYQLVEGDNRIGRDPGNEIVIDDPYVSRRHAMIRVSGQQVHLFDQGGTGGITVDGKPLGGAVIEHGAGLVVGQTRLGLLGIDDNNRDHQVMNGAGTLLARKEPGKGVLIVQSGPDAGDRFDLTSGVNTIGRSKDRDACLTDNTVSRLHALIRLEDHGITVQDAGSKSGTEVDGTSLGGLPLQEWSSINLGHTRLTIVWS